MLRVPNSSGAVVVIGASLGGPSALQRVLSSLPSELPAAILVVQHRAAGGRDDLVTLLRPACALEVKRADDGAAIRPGVIYVAPADRHLEVSEVGRVRLADHAKVQHARPSADVLFRSVAAVFGARSIGVVLTGGLQDGADGVRAIKQAGGCVLVQDPESCRASGMPLAAIATGCVDAVVPVDQLAQAIISRVMANGGS